MERLQKVIASSGVCSRRKAEELIKNGKVKVDGKIVTEMGFKVNHKNVVEVDGVKIEPEEKEYYLLNKPRGVVSTACDDKGRKTVVDLIETDKRIYPIGRLDYDTTGLLLLTNDGAFANAFMHPKYEIDKVYVAKVKGIVKAKHVIPLQNGVVIDGKKTSKAKVKIRKTDLKTNTSMVEIIIHEGYNHQVKKMFEAVGLEVLKLKRERVAFLTLKGVASGKYRKLNAKELKQLYDVISHKK